MSRQESPTTPEKLGRYEILGELGKGAMGVVYLARDPIIGRKLAIKTFNLAYPAREKEADIFRQRFLREAQSAGILNHPNIVTIHDVMEDPNHGGGYCIAMEYVKGIDLKQQMQREGKLPLDFAIDLVAQIADGLAYAHAKGVVHRDVKPANIILTAEKQAKITDFGIARVEASNLTQKGQLLGTPNYMSPEQIQGLPVDHRADLFSLGVMLYELLTRKKPFQGENLSAVTHRIVFDTFTPLVEIVPGIPPRLDEILLKALSKKPDERYQDGADMAADLRAVLRAIAPSKPEPEMTSATSTAAPLPAWTPPPPPSIPPPPPPLTPPSLAPPSLTPPSEFSTPPLPPLPVPKPEPPPVPVAAPVTATPVTATPVTATPTVQTAPPPKVTPVPPSRPAPAKPAPVKAAPAKAAKPGRPLAAVAVILGLIAVAALAFFLRSKGDAAATRATAQPVVSELNRPEAIAEKRAAMMALFDTLHQQIEAVETAVAEPQAVDAEGVGAEGVDAEENSLIPDLADPEALAALARGTFTRLDEMAGDPTSPLRYEREIRRNMLDAARSMAVLDDLLGRENLESVWLADRLAAVETLIAEGDIEEARIVLARVMELQPENSDALDLQSALRRHARQPPPASSPQIVEAAPPPPPPEEVPPPAVVAPSKSVVRIELHTLWNEGTIEVKLDGKSIYTKKLETVPGDTKTFRRREFKDPQVVVQEVEWDAGTWSLKVSATLIQRGDPVERESGLGEFVLEPDGKRTLKIIVTADPSMRVETP